MCMCVTLMLVDKSIRECPLTKVSDRFLLGGRRSKIGIGERNQIRNQIEDERASSVIFDR